MDRDGWFEEYPSNQSFSFSPSLVLASPILNFGLEFVQRFFFEWGPNLLMSFGLEDSNFRVSLPLFPSIFLFHHFRMNFRWFSFIAFRRKSREICWRLLLLGSLWATLVWFPLKSLTNLAWIWSFPKSRSWKGRSVFLYICSEYSIFSQSFSWIC